MKFQHLLRLTGIATVCAPVAFGFAEIGRGELLLATSARETYDSRVLGGLSPQDDFIFTFEPRLLYQHDSGVLTLDGMLGTRINRYAQLTQFNSDDLETSVRLNLPQQSAAPLFGFASASYDEHTQINYDVNTRIREKTFLSQLNGNIPVGLKALLLLNGMFRHDDRNIFSNRETREGSAGFRYLDFPGGTTLDLLYNRLEVDTSGGNAVGVPLNQRSDTYSIALARPLYQDVRGSISYGYRVLHRSAEEIAVLGPANASGSVLALNLDGPFLPRRLFPKLESTLSVGYQKAETPGINDKGGRRLFATLHVAWHARERTEVSFDARRGRELSVNDVTVETTNITANLRQGIGDFMAGTLTAGYERRDYLALGRSDDVALAGATLSYRITKYWSADANYQLRASHSSSTTANYSRHLVALTVTYTF